MRTIDELSERIKSELEKESPDWAALEVLLCQLKKARNREDAEQLIERLDNRRAMRFMSWATAHMIERKMTFPPRYQSASVADLIREYDAWCVREIETIGERTTDADSA